MAQQPAGSDGVAVAVSEAVSRLYLDKFGKGPLHAETHIHGDVIVTLLKDVYTTAEQTIAEDGGEEGVLTRRMQLQRATDDQFRSAVADVTGRRVVAAISGFEYPEQMATEVFVLEPH